MKSLKIGLFAVLSLASLARAEDVLARWRKPVTVRPVCADEAAHSIHSYYMISPESPDGRFVLYYKSTTPESEFGDLHVIERATAADRVIARNIHTEDAHRVAAQQWLSGGRRVAYQDQRNSEWLTAVVDFATGEDKVLAKGRLSGWGRSSDDVVPLYGPHWDPGEHRDLEVGNVATGEVKTLLTAKQVAETFPDYMAKTFGGKPISVFFPVISPDGNRIFFKASAVKSGVARSEDASVREGRFTWDIRENKLLPLGERWGHPYWLPDSRTIFDLPLGGMLTDVETGTAKVIPNIPAFTSSHASASPDGKLFIADNKLNRFGGPESSWGIIVGDLTGKDGVVWIHKFDHSGGATSWRAPHPHPVMSADGKRIYFNVNVGKWTRLFVAEAAE